MSLSTRVVPTKVVSIYPYTRGFAYAVMDSPVNLIEFRLFELKKLDVNRIVLLVLEIVEKHQPVTVVLEDTNSKYCRKGARTKQLIRAIALAVKKKSVEIDFISRDKVRQIFRRWNAKNKYEIAEVLIRNIYQLGAIKMEKPKYPGREPNVEAVFSAVSFAIVNFFSN
ncbi:hypothetical protein [Gilvibacter sediminis]|uniref:hypothetical protein n=1 Tax=Gilvibacter sediminis TaxID=379071 RepID=UPI0023503929|nr:hypothetical protein [Gilvibacter sediminis]MDC7996906.1 hypothetical protein [Gilvibacter sediminis]